MTLISSICLSPVIPKPQCHIMVQEDLGSYPDYSVSGQHDINLSHGGLLCKETILNFNTMSYK